MARRSAAVLSREETVAEIKELLDSFLERLDHSDLRQQVISLVPAVHSLRDLGSGLLVGTHITSGKDRILAYLRKYPGTLIDGDELMVVAGIGEWARRVRELRVEAGWRIYTGATLNDMLEDAPEFEDELKTLLGSDEIRIRPDQYVLISEEQDREAAHRWKLLNSIRKKPGGVKTKILEYLRENVGHVVTGEELRYLARDKKEWARRIRELRTEDGWPVITRMHGRPDLAVGEYLLEEDRQAEPHDRKIDDATRVEVLTRDAFQCTFCGWSRDDLNPADPRKFLELHHLEHHADGGSNTSENLRTLCNVHHDEVHAGRLLWDKGKWIRPHT